MKVHISKRFRKDRVFSMADGWLGAEGSEAATGLGLALGMEPDLAAPQSALLLAARANGGRKEEKMLTNHRLSCCF